MTRLALCSQPAAENHHNISLNASREGYILNSSFSLRGIYIARASRLLMLLDKGPNALASLSASVKGPFEGYLWRLIFSLVVYKARYFYLFKKKEIIIFAVICHH